jgi:hypothetical protein
MSLASLEAPSRRDREDLGLRTRTRGTMVSIPSAPLFFQPHRAFLFGEVCDAQLGILPERAEDAPLPVWINRV